MKNYYEELEVSKTASKDVIEKVYKVLAKKYHPDTTKEIDKQAAEEKFKIISEAYEVLSDDEKREKYDLELEESNPTISYEEYINIVNQRDTLQNELYQYKNQNNVTNQYYNNQASSNSYYTNTATNLNTNTNSASTSRKNQYYYTDTGKPASAFDYYKYKIKNFFSNILFYLAILLLIIVALKKLSSYVF